jgi:cell division protein FtsQ
MPARSAAHAARLPRRRTRARRAPRARRAGRIWIRRVVAVVLLTGALAAAYLLWLRDSSLFAVRDVEVVGVSSADRDEIGRALERAAHEMTTLHVREDALRAAARPYPSVKSVRAHPQLPTGLEIEVTEHRPVTVVEVDGRDLPVAADGTLLPGVSTAGLDLPPLDATADASAERLSEGALEQARVLGAVPEPLRALIEQATEDADGVAVRLANGITLRFGDATRADAKWAAAARILADSELGSLSYIDVRAPERPAVGGAGVAPGAT